jgi:hypothetical protein
MTEKLDLRLNFAVHQAPITHGEPILDMQLVQERITNSAMELFASTCVLSRPESEVEVARHNGESAPPEQLAALPFLPQSFRRVRGFLSGLTDNDYKAVLAAAGSCLSKSPAS